jgi:hypothetical protein
MKISPKIGNLGEPQLQSAEGFDMVEDAEKGMDEISKIYDETVLETEIELIGDFNSVG